MDRLRLFFYREGEHFEYPEDVRAAYGEPVRISLFHHDAARPDGFDTVSSPHEADFIVFPYELGPIICHRRTPFTRNFLEGLPYFAELEHKHVLFNFHDQGQPLCTRACIITDAPARSNRDDPFVYPYPHFPLKHVLAASPDHGFEAIRFDVSFVGTISDAVRLTLLESIQREKRLRHYLNAPMAPDWERSASYLHMANTARRQALERLYVGVMRRSWATLCPRGRAASSFRFFETLCMGRLPVHVSDEYVLPLAERINYAAFTLFVPEAEAPRAGELVHDWLAGKSLDERKAMCRQARQAWEEHLAPWRAQEIALDVLRRHRMVMPRGPARLVRMAPGALKAEAPRRQYPTGYFAGMALDDGRSWFTGAMLLLEGPRPDTVLVNNAVGEFPRAALNHLYHAGRGLPANACVVDLGCGAGVSSIVFANALLSRRRMNARVFCVDDWAGSELDGLRPNARHAGVEFMLHPLALNGAEAAELFRDGSVDLLFLNRGRGVADLEPWWDKLRPGGVIFGCCRLEEPEGVALRACAVQGGALWESNAALGLFRIRRPMPGALPGVDSKARSFGFA
ncbi:MAG: exostosin family protein [Humidesulfovibrio sp.]|nr:exostosin family protein [Humidesulfovibrio sp.]